MDPKNKKSSASFGIFITIILIFSTVIVFTVLLFLSYESILNNDNIKVQNETQRLCNVISFSIESSIDETDGLAIGGSNQKNFRNMINYLSENYDGSIYIVTKKDQIFCSAKPDEMFEAKIPQVIEAGDTMSKFKLDDNRTMIATCTQIENTQLYCVCASVLDRESAKDEFVNVILLPVLIAVMFAIVLFVFAIQLTLAPIRDMSSTIKKVSEGDYSVRVDKKYVDSANIHNITSAGDIVSMASTLNDMLDKLENQEHDRQIFISSVAHDIRTPLTSINGFVTAILDGTIPPENMDKYLNLIKQEVNRIKALVVSMTEASSLSHIDPAAMEEFPLDDVINDIIVNLEPQLAEKNIKCIARLSDEPMTKMCYGEAQQLCRVIVNIITNAIKFTPQDGMIIVTTNPVKSEKKVQISVEDSGIGIPEEKRSRIFESFYKVDSSRTKEGFGLGLYICKQILTGHGQTIYVDESEELGGAKFIFTFPIPPEAR